MKLSILLASAISAAVAVSAAAAQDPTRPSEAMAGAMRGRIADVSDLAVRALVVGASDDGVALLGSRDFTGAPVRRGAIVNQDVGGINVPLAVESVTSAGVKIRTSAADGGEWTLPGSFQPLPPPDGEEPLLRYVEFTRVPLATALRLVSDQSGANISASATTEGTSSSASRRESSSTRTITFSSCSCRACT